MAEEGNRRRRKEREGGGGKEEERRKKKRGRGEAERRCGETYAEWRVLVVSEGVHVKKRGGGGGDHPQTSSITRRRTSASVISDFFFPFKVSNFLRDFLLILSCENSNGTCSGQTVSPGKILLHIHIKQT